MEIVLGVTGGIAAYKAAEIVRGLKREGAGVTVVMTAHALEFITPLTLQTLSGRRVITSHFDLAGSDQPEDVEHIGLALGCDLLLVAPATAGILAKMAARIQPRTRPSSPSSFANSQNSPLPWIESRAPWAGAIARTASTSSRRL